MGQRRLLSKLHAGIRPFLQALRGHPWRVRFLFRAQLPLQRRPQYDTTTIALRYALDKWAASRRTALEIGIGEAALLSIYPALIHGLGVDGIDISAKRVSMSREVISVNQASVRIWESDLFDRVDGKYDLIFFNPPYVPTAVGRDLSLTRRGDFDSNRVWDGGPDGTDVIRSFLAEVPVHLTDDGVVLEGAQRFYIPREKMCRLVERNGLRVLCVKKRFANPRLVWVLGMAEAPLVKSQAC